MTDPIQDQMNKAAADRMFEEIDMPMSFQSPESSTIEGADYDPTTLTLTVRFKRGVRDKTDPVYVFPAVPITEWEQFLAATSKGAYFTKCIRPIYSPKKK